MEGFPRTDIGSADMASAVRDQDLISIGGIFAALWRNAWILVLACAAGIGLAYHYAFNVAVPVYEARASLVLETRAQSFIDLQATTTALSRDVTSLNTEVTIMRGRELMGEVVEILNLVEDPEFNPLLLTPEYEENREALAQRASDLAVSILLSKTQVWNPPLSLVFEVTATTTDPAKSTLIADTIVDQYIEQQLELKVEATAEANDWLTTRVAQLQDELQAAESQVEQFRFASGSSDRSQALVRLERLTSEAEAIRELYQYFLTRLKETSVQEGLQQPDSRVLSYAVVPFSPSAPRKYLLLAVGAILGGFLGLVIVFLKEATMTGFRTPADLERQTGYPVIGEIPKVAWLPRQSPVKWLISSRAALYSQAVNDLHTTLFLEGSGEPPRLILLLSSVPGEGKTSLSLSLAHNLAWRNERTLVIDGDLRRRSLSRIFGDGHNNGLGLALWSNASLKDVVVQNRALNIDILCCEANTHNPVDVFSSKEFRVLLEEAKASYRTVIIDSPPLLAVSDALALAKVAQKSIFLVRWKRSSAKKVLECLEMLRLVGVRPTGLVMTRMKPSLLGSSEFQDYFRQAAAAGDRPS